MGRWMCAAFAAVAATLFAAPALAQGNGVTIGFELTVEGTPPEGATFFAQYLADGATVQLTDTDGDGVYTGEMSGGRPDAGFRIVQGTGVEQAMTGVYPGEPLRVIEKFPAPDGAATLSSSVAFEDDAGGGAAGETVSGETVSVTGVVEKPQMTTYMYGTHSVTDQATGIRYALSSESVDLDEYVGKRATVSGQLVPGYEDGQVEGGPPLVEVAAAAEAADGGARETAVAFEVTIGGEVPRDASLRVESGAVSDGPICGTGGKAACRGAGETERLEVEMPAGERFEYRILASVGDASEAVVAEGSGVADEGVVVRASYEFPKGTASGGAGGEDVNGDGEVDEADADHAARVSDQAKRAIDPDRNPLPVTGGVALLVLLSGAALAAGGYAIRRALR